MHLCHDQTVCFAGSFINLVPKYLVSFPPHHHPEVTFVWTEFLITSFLQHLSLSGCFFSNRRIEVFHSEILARKGYCVSTAV